MRFDSGGRYTSHQEAAASAPIANFARLLTSGFTRKPKTIPRPSHPTRLRVEALEDRWVPDGDPVGNPPPPQPLPLPAILVTTELDVVNPADGLTSLREAIDYVNLNGNPQVQQRITFAGNLADTTFGLTSQLPKITKNIFIDGLGGAQTIERDATQGNFRLLEVESGGVLRIEHLTLQGGYVDQALPGLPGVGGGGAIWAKGALHATDCDFSGNNVSSDLAFGEGGAIWASGQTAPDGTVIGLLVITDCRFWFNSARYGGAVSAAGKMQNIQVSNSAFWQNEAFHSGGAIYLGGQSNSTYPDTTATISNCTIDDNTAAQRGGGICALNLWLELTQGTIISNNQAALGGGVYVGGSVFNGVVHGLIKYAGVSIGGNTASDSGNGVYRDSAARITDNQNGGVTWFGNPPNGEVVVNDPGP